MVYAFDDPEEILRKSKCLVENASTKLHFSDGAGTLSDVCMGARRIDETCVWCRTEAPECVCDVYGHFDLPVPVFWKKYAGFVARQIASLCSECAGNDLCERCVEPVDAKFVDGALKIVTSRRIMNGKKVDVAETWSAKKTREFLKRVPDDAWRRRGIDASTTRPENAICTIVCVIPNKRRSWKRLRNSDYVPDDRTKQYSVLLSRCQDFRNRAAETSDPTKRTEALVEMRRLEKEIYVDLNALAESSNAGEIDQSRRISTEKRRRPTAATTTKPGILTKLRRKEGDFRNLVLGKRVDGCARSVASSNPGLRLGQIGVPRRVADVLVFPERVCALNYDRLLSGVYDGSVNYLVDVDGTRYCLLDCDFSERRRIASKSFRTGCVADRKLRNGDVVLANRQPTLHLLSMVGLSVEITDDDTFQFPLPVTDGFNMDFDGDEANIFVPSSWEAAAEISELAHATKNLVTPDGFPCFPFVQNAVVAAYCMSKPGASRVDERTFFDAATCVDGYVPPPRSDDSSFSASDLLKICLPPNWSGRGVPRSDGVRRVEDLGKGRVTLGGDVFGDRRRSVVDEGSWGKKVLGKGSKGLVAELARFGDSKVVSTFYSVFDEVVSAWLKNYGLSFGFGDLDYPGRSKISRNLDDVFAAESSAETVFACASEALGEAYVESHFVDMVKSGAKGSFANVVNVVETLGELTVGGTTYAESRLRLPCLRRGDDGRTRNGYVKGLNPHEYFLGLSKARYDLSCKAVMTQEAGYMARRLNSAFTAYRTETDGTVRDDSGDVVQFLYGDDGADPSKQIPVDESFEEEEDDEEFVSLEFPDAEGKKEYASARRRKFRRTYFETRDSEKKLKWWAPSVGRDDEIRRICETTTFRSFGIVDETARAWFARRFPWPALLGNDPSDLADVVETLKIRHERSRVDAGTSVGLNASLRMGEPLTQSVLNTFHAPSGTRSSSGRVDPKELLTLYNAKSRVCTLRTERNETLSAARSGKISFVDSKYVDKIPKSSDWTERWCRAFDTDFDDVNPVLILKFDERRTTTRAVADTLRTRLEATKYRVSDDEWDDELVAHVSVDDEEAVADVESLFFDARHFISSEDDGEETIYEMRREAAKSKSFRKRTTAAADDEDEDGQDDDDELAERRLTDHRGPLRKLFEAFPELNHSKTITDDVYDVWATLGVEAAVAVLRKQFRSSFETLHPSHVSLLCDVLTKKGCLENVNITGITRLTNSVAARACFERADVHVASAASTGKRDVVDNKFFRIFSGQKIRHGGFKVEFEEGFGDPIEATDFFDEIDEVIERSAKRSRIHEEKEEEKEEDVPPPRTYSPSQSHYDPLSRDDDDDDGYYSPSAAYDSPSHPPRTYSPSCSDYDPTGDRSYRPSDDYYATTRDDEYRDDW